MTSVRPPDWPIMLPDCYSVLTRQANSPASSPTLDEPLIQPDRKLKLMDQVGQVVHYNQYSYRIEKLQPRALKKF